MCNNKKKLTDHALTVNLVGLDIIVLGPPRARQEYTLQTPAGASESLSASQRLARRAAARGTARFFCEGLVTHLLASGHNEEGEDEKRTTPRDTPQLDDGPCRAIPQPPAFPRAPQREDLPCIDGPTGSCWTLLRGRAG